MTILPAHDMPDDYDWLPGSARFPLSDLGELAARLKSPDTFDRRGDVLWMDVGDKGLGSYAYSYFGVGSSVMVLATYALHGSYALWLTAGSTLSCNAALSKMLANSSMLRAGLEIAFCLLSPALYFRTRLIYFIGTQQLDVNIRYNFATTALEYQGSDGVFYAFATVGQLDNPYGIYHHLKLVVDFTIGHYVRCLFNDIEYDLSAHAVRTAPFVGVSHYELWVVQEGRPLNNDQAIIGHVIMTGNEP